MCTRRITRDRISAGDGRSPGQRSRRHWHGRFRELPSEINPNVRLDTVQPLDDVVWRYDAMQLAVFERDRRASCRSWACSSRLPASSR